jgi:hypothetical protein
MLALLLVCATASSAQVRLSSLQPLSVRVLNPGWQNMSPAQVNLGEFSDVLALRSETDVVYAVPEGQTLFSATLLFASHSEVKAPEQDLDTRIRVRVYADNRLLLDVALERAQPALRFAVSVAGASRLTIRSRDFFPPATFYLSGAIFGQGEEEAVHAVPSPGGAYAGFHAIAQSLMRKLEPGTAALVDVSVAGSLAAVELRVTVHPAGGGAVVVATIPVTLRPMGGTSVGTARWQVPELRGPLQLDLQLTNGSKLLWQRALLVAVEPQLELARVGDTELGVGVSNQGYAKAMDEFAYLWNAKWARIFVRWDAMQPQPGPIDFRQMDEVMEDYQKQQMKVLLVLGERTPAWADHNSPQDQQTLREFSRQVVRRYAGKVAAWEAYNEINGGFKWEAHYGHQPEWDLDSLRTVISVLRAEDAKTPVVCCSSSSTTRLDYEKRLLAHHALEQVDILALHPYQKWNPEQRQGPYDLERLAGGLLELASQIGIHKPIWFTEAEWIMGSKSDKWVTAPFLDDNQQARYMQRATLLSMPVAGKYIAHVPFLYSSHRNEHIQSLAAEAALMALFADASQARYLLNGPQLYGVVALTPRGLAGALWGIGGEAKVALEGLRGLRLMDMYGNPLTATASALSLTGEPLLFMAAGGQPKVQILRTAAEPHFAPLPEWDAWSRNSSLDYITEGQHLYVHNPLVRWNSALTSPPIPVNSGSCYVIQVPMRVSQGALRLQVNDAFGGSRIAYEPFDFPPGLSEATVAVRFMAEASRQVQVVIGAANNVVPAVTDFELTGRAAIAACDSN